jgi:hypothetical protein
VPPGVASRPSALMLLLLTCIDRPRFTLPLLSAGRAMASRPCAWDGSNCRASARRPPAELLRPLGPGGGRSLDAASSNASNDIYSRTGVVSPAPVNCRAQYPGRDPRERCPPTGTATAVCDLSPGVVIVGWAPRGRYGSGQLSDQVAEPGGQLACAARHLCPAVRA